MESGEAADAAGDDVHQETWVLRVDEDFGDRGGVFDVTLVDGEVGVKCVC